MCHRQHIELICQRIYYLLKNGGLLCFVPILIIDIILPVLNTAAYSTYGLCDEFYKSVSELCQIFIPFLSVWWPVLIFREFVDSDGSEMLYAAKKAPSGSALTAVFLLYCADITLLYVLYFIFFKWSIIELAKILAVCMFYFGSSVMLSKITKSTSITLLFLVIYTLINLFGYRFAGIFPLYYTNVPTTIKIILTNSLPLALCGVLELSAGLLIKKRAAK